MTLREIFALASAAVMTVGTVWYIVLISKKNENVKPVLAAWIVMASTLNLSFATYWTSPKHNLISNAGNAAAAISSFSILAVIVWLQIKHSVKLVFSSFQKWCLGIAGAIAALWVIVVWGLGGTGVIPNMLTQMLMLVGYVATGERLLKSEKNTEPFFFWICIFISGVFALFVAVKSIDPLAYVYAVRATVTTAILLVLMYIADRKPKTVPRMKPQFE